MKRGVPTWSRRELDEVFRFLCSLSSTDRGTSLEKIYLRKLPETNEEGFKPPKTTLYHDYPMTELQQSLADLKRPGPGCTTFKRLASLNRGHNPLMKVKFKNLRFLSLGIRDHEKLARLGLASWENRLPKVTEERLPVLGKKTEDLDLSLRWWSLVINQRLCEDGSSSIATIRLSSALQL